MGHGGGLDVTFGVGRAGGVTLGDLTAWKADELRGKTAVCSCKPPFPVSAGCCTVAAWSCWSA